MGWIFLLVIIAIALIAALVITNAKHGEEVWPFYARKLLSQPEQVLYFRLVQALPDHIVLAQVQLSRLLGVKKGNRSQAWLNRINRMSADFVICKKDASVWAVIELDDSSHQKERRKIADAKKDKALQSANIRMIRWQVHAMPEVAVMREILLQHAEFHALQPPFK